MVGQTHRRSRPSSSSPCWASSACCAPHRPASAGTSISTTSCARRPRCFRTISAHVGRRLGLDGIADGEPRAADPSLHDHEWIERFASGPDGFDQGAARRELARQLGPRWTGYANAEPHVRCLFAAFALHASRDRDGAISCSARLRSLCQAAIPRSIFPSAPLLRRMRRCATRM